MTTEDTTETTTEGRGTKRHAIRIDDALWAEFGRVATEAGTDRTALLVGYVKRYIRTHGGVVPPELTRKRRTPRRAAAGS